MEEIWKDIEGYEGLYQVSNLGRVKSFKRKNIKIMKSSVDFNGYSHVNLYKNDTKRGFKVHRLVCFAFLPYLIEKPQVNHINGIKTDNRLKNLEWCDQSHNQQHAYDTGLKIGRIGEKNGRSKLTKEQVYEIKYNSKYLEVNQLSKFYNVTKTMIRFIIKGKSWKHI
jgi:hypothetical protein